MPQASGWACQNGELNTPSALSPGLGFIFDLDGVIVDSMPLHVESWRSYLADLGIEIPELETRMHGRRNDDIVLEFIDKKLMPDEVFAHGAAKEALFRRLLEQQLREFIVPGVPQFLARFRDVPIGIASNAERANIDFVLDGAGLREFFTALVDGHQVERPKPYPDIYLRAAELLGTAARDCIVFEDSPTGIEAAKASGARVVAIETHRGALPSVDFRAKDFNDERLAPWLQSLRPR